MRSMVKHNIVNVDDDRRFKVTHQHCATFKLRSPRIPDRIDSQPIIRQDCKL